VTVRRRLVVLSAAAVAVAIVLASVVVFAVVRAELRGQVDEALRGLAPDVFVDHAEAPAGGPRIQRRTLAPGPTRGTVVVPADPLGGATGVAQAVTATGEVVNPAGSRARLPVDSRVIAVARGERDAFFRDATVGGTHVRIFTSPGLAGDALQVARPLTEVDDALRRLVLVLAAISLGGIGLAGGLGLLVARGTLAPVVRLTDAAEHVAGTHDLSRRLDVREEGDELDRLGAAFNTMLAALERSRAAQRQLVADASHELRTPLTSVRANIEALGRARDLPVEERDRIVASARAQLEELTVLVGDLVDLARPDVPGLEADRAVAGVRAAAPSREQPARQRGEVEPARRGDRRDGRPRPRRRPRPRPRLRAGGPAARLRALLSRPRGARAAGLGARARDRPADRRGARRARDCAQRARRRGAARAGAAGTFSDLLGPSQHPFTCGWLHPPPTTKEDIA
jgi:two-component system, OmpR family, sensor histidine kinase MprB